MGITALLTERPFSAVRRGVALDAPSPRRGRAVVGRTGDDGHAARLRARLRPARARVAAGGAGGADAPQDEAQRSLVMLTAGRSAWPPSATCATTSASRWPSRCLDARASWLGLEASWSLGRGELVRALR